MSSTVTLATTFDPIADLKNHISIPVESVIRNKELIVPDYPNAFKSQKITSLNSKNCPLPTSTILFNIPPLNQITCDEYKDPALIGIEKNLNTKNTEVNLKPDISTVSKSNNNTITAMMKNFNNLPINSSTSPNAPYPDLPIKSNESTSINYDTSRFFGGDITTFSYSDFTTTQQTPPKLTKVGMTMQATNIITLIFSILLIFIKKYFSHKKIQKC